ncbi:methyltransferase [Seonamhaeicola sp. NFXS20]|uniref:methyltransferase n=1 Tax=unclassified Seonamhaeicola TaxID=2622645 RepID=UPI003563C21C
MYEKSFPNKRFKHTISFLKKHITTTETILDLGVENPFSKIMLEHGYKVKNTSGEDLDEDVSNIKNSEANVVTAFEIFEHLLSPYTVLKEIKANKLVASIPLKLWFAPAYKSKTDKWDRHYHEFEDWQFDWLLEKTGWKIIDSQKWTNPTKKIGIRPILRWFTPRYYIVYAKRVNKEHHK